MSRNLTIQLPSLVGIQEFTPSGLMIKVLCAYLQGLSKDSSLSVLQILDSLKASKQNWYNWQRKEGFIEWWTQAIQKYHTTTGLSHVYGAVYRRATASSPQDAKMYLERFDKDYKPATAQEHTFPGVVPPEAIAPALERSRQRAKAVQSAVQDRPQATQQADTGHKSGQGVVEEDMGA